MKKYIFIMFLLNLTVSLLKAQVTQIEADSIIQRYIKTENEILIHTNFYINLGCTLLLQ
jgi:hypothetical protein